MGKLVFSSRKQGDCTVLSIGGEIDTGVAPELDGKLKEALAGGSRFIGDLSGLEHLTSAGIGVLMDFKQQALKKGGDFRLAAVTEKIMKVFSLMNLTKAISVHATVEEAGKAF